MVKLDGAVETACRLGVADAVCDVVETGTTLRAAGLQIIGRAGADQRGDPGPPGGRRGDPGGRPAAAPAARRPRRPPVRDARLRLPERACSSRPPPITPGHRGADGQPAADARLVGGARDGARRPTPTGSWTSSGSSAPAPSWSRASTPPASEPAHASAPATSPAVRRLDRRAHPAASLALLALLTACASRRGGSAAAAAPADAPTRPAGGGIARPRTTCRSSSTAATAPSPRRWTLTCAGIADGTHPDAEAACAHLDGAGRPVRAAARPTSPAPSSTAARRRRTSPAAGTASRSTSSSPGPTAAASPSGTASGRCCRGRSD